MRAKVRLSFMLFRSSVAAPPSFQFLPHAPLVDGDLELVAPAERYFEYALAACRHPLTMAETPDQSKITRQSLADFVASAPNGHYPGSTGKHNRVPSYHFWMKLTGNHPVRIAGGLGLRISNCADVVQYVGHIGYNVHPPVRGMHLAERSCRLVLPIAKAHGLKQIWITCNPENIASRKTCERLGAIYVNTVPVPTDHELYARGDKEKCRYRIDL